MCGGRLFMRWSWLCHIRTGQRAQAAVPQGTAEGRQLPPHRWSPLVHLIPTVNAHTTARLLLALQRAHATCLSSGTRRSQRLRPPSRP